MSKATRLEVELPVADRLERLRSVVEALPEGDQDREDLILLYTELDRVKTLNAKLKGRLRGARKLREENRRLSGALSLCRFALKTAMDTIAQKEVTVGWLRRRVGQRTDLADYEKKQLRALALEDRMDHDRRLQETDG